MSREIATNDDLYTNVILRSKIGLERLNNLSPSVNIAKHEPEFEAIVQALEQGFLNSNGNGFGLLENVTKIARRYGTTSDIPKALLWSIVEGAAQPEFRPGETDVAVEEIIGADTQLAKLRFVEELVGFTMGKTGSEARRSIAGVRNNLLGWVRNDKKHDLLQRKYDIKFDEVDTEVLKNYAERFFLSPGSKDWNLFGINPATLAEINADIEKADEIQKPKLERVKQVLGGLTQAMYREIDKRIDSEKLTEIEQAMREQINYYNGEQRENTINGINGHTGAGKGTTLEMLGVTAVVETGTTGIAGHAGAYEQYTQVMGPYDMARETGQFIPNNVMRLLFATEMMAQRQKLDSEGRYEEAVYISGFPRSQAQAEVFVGIKNIKSIALTITPETAVGRTLERIAESIHSNEDIRGDAFADLEMKSNSQLDRDFVRRLVKVRLASHLKDRSTIDIKVLAKDLENDGTQLLRIGPRYRKYAGDLVKINDALEAAGIETTYIECDGLEPQEVTAKVRQAL